MFTTILSWMLKGHSAKITSGIIGGGGIITLILGLHTNVTSRIDSIQLKTEKYVDQRHDLVQGEVLHLKEGLKEIKDLLKIIDKRLYDIKYK